MISHDFPPIVSSTSQRVGEFTIRLAERDWAVDVVTTRVPGNHPNVDPAPLAHLPASLSIHRSDAGIGYHLGLRRGSLGHLVRSLPGRYLTWVLPALRLSRELVAARRYEALYSIGFPWVAHQVAYAVRRVSGLDWIADYSDPWTLHPLAEKRITNGLARRAESILLRQCHRVVVNSETTYQAYSAGFPFLVANRLSLIPFGYDERLIRHVRTATHHRVSGDRLRLCYIGNIYPTQNAQILLDVLTGFPQISLFFAGSFIDEPSLECRTLVARLQARGQLEWCPFVAQEEGVRQVLASSVAVVFGHYQIPAKLYTAIGCQRPVLLVSSGPDDPSARLIRRERRGLVTDNTRDDIRSSLSTLQDLWRRNTLEDAFNLQDVTQYSWDRVVGRLESMLV